MANKNKKKSNQKANALKAEEVKQEEAQSLAEQVVPEAEASAPAEKEKSGKAVEVKAKDVDKKKKKDKPKKPNKMVKAIKDTGSELKKVTWPTFGKVVKQTGIVLVVVLVFALVLLGLDFVCMHLVELLVK